VSDPYRAATKTHGSFPGLRPSLTEPALQAKAGSLSLGCARSRGRDGSDLLQSTGLTERFGDNRSLGRTRLLKFAWD